MRSRQGAVLESLQRAQAFLEKNATLLGPVVQSTGKQLGDVVDLLTTHAINQEGGTRAVRGETTRQRRLRFVLRFSHMRPIAEVARLKLRDVPNFTALTMPTSNATVQRLIAAAGGMADTAAPHEAVFVEAGLPAGFLVQLRQAAADVHASILGRSDFRGERSGATAGLIAEERRGRVMLKVLDSLVTPLLGSNDKLLAEWRVAKQIHRVPVVPTDGPVTPTTTPAPKPAATTGTTPAVATSSLPPKPAAVAESHPATASAPVA